MIKNNNKGFMLIEVIITSTIVVTSMVFLYTSFSRLYNNFKSKTSYYHIDTSYASKEIIDSLINENLLNNIINESLEDKSFGYIIKNGSCIKNTYNSTCSKIKNLYDIENSIMVNYSIDSLNELKNNVINKTLSDYIDYLINYYDLSNNEDDYNFIVITESKDNVKYFYSNLRVR